MLFLDVSFSNFLFQVVYLVIIIISGERGPMLDIGLLRGWSNRLTGRHPKRWSDNLVKIAGTQRVEMAQQF